MKGLDFTVAYNSDWPQFYILFDALERCKEVTTRLNQEISNMHILAEDSENEEE